MRIQDTFAQLRTALNRTALTSASRQDLLRLRCVTVNKRHKEIRPTSSIRSARHCLQANVKSLGLSGRRYIMDMIASANEHMNTVAIWEPRENWPPRAARAWSAAGFAVRTLVQSLAGRGRECHEHFRRIADAGAVDEVVRGRHCRATRDDEGGLRDVFST